MQFKHIENLNYAVALCRDVLRLNMPATGGVDLYDGNRTLVLGLTWQLMRMQVIDMLKDVGGGSNVTDADIVAWANATVAATGRSSHLSSFKVLCAASCPRLGPPPPTVTPLPALQPAASLVVFVPSPSLPPPLT